MNILDDIALTLTDAIALAEAVINRAAINDRLPAIASLNNRLDALAERSIEGGVNPVGPEVGMLFEALCHIEKARLENNRERLTIFCMVAGIFLPLARNALGAAIAARQTLQKRGPVL